MGFFSFSRKVFVVMENIIEVKLTELHPFQVREDDAMRETVESIREYGVMTPIIVRNREEGGYPAASENTNTNPASAMLNRWCGIFG